MKIVATSDTHFPFDNIPEGDVFLHAGDLMYTGYPDEWYPRLESLGDLEHETKILVPGNHDFHIQNYHGIAKSELRRAGVTLCGIGQPLLDLGGDKILLGVPYVTGLRGWAYERNEQELLRHLRLLQTAVEHIDIVVSHMPPYDILDAIHPEETSRRKRELCGSRALRTWFDALKIKPKHWFFGHIHESYGQTSVEGCTFYNVAMCNDKYKQTNPPIIVEI